MNRLSEYKKDWDAVMDDTKNPLKTYPRSRAYMLMQILAWMWASIFTISIYNFSSFGTTVVGHFLVILGILITTMFFQIAEERGSQNVHQDN